MQQSASCARPAAGTRSGTCTSSRTWANSSAKTRSVSPMVPSRIKPAMGIKARTCRPWTRTSAGAQFLNRVTRWTSSGLELEADPKHIRLDPWVGGGSVQGFGYAGEDRGSIAWSWHAPERVGRASFRQERSHRELCVAGSLGLELRVEAVSPGNGQSAH